MSKKSACFGMALALLPVSSLSLASGEGGPGNNMREQVCKVQKARVLRELRSAEKSKPKANPGIWTLEEAKQQRQERIQELQGNLAKVKVFVDVLHHGWVDESTPSSEVDMQLVDVYYDCAKKSMRARVRHTNPRFQNDLTKRDEDLAATLDFDPKSEVVKIAIQDYSKGSLGYELKLETGYAARVTIDVTGKTEHGNTTVHESGTEVYSEFFRTREEAQAFVKSTESIRPDRKKRTVEISPRRMILLKGAMLAFSATRTIDGKVDGDSSADTSEVTHQALSSAMFYPQTEDGLFGDIAKDPKIAWNQLDYVALFTALKTNR